jgi:hypothetical protein
MLSPEVLRESFVQAIISGDAAVMTGAIIGDSIAAPDERLAVYHHNVVGGLREILGATFSATQALVGEDFFAQMARAFASAHPPDHGDINGYGGGFPAFIADYEPVRSLPFLADVAQLEWFWGEAYLAADDDPVSPEQIAALSPDDYPGLCLTLRASVRLLESPWPVVAIRDWVLGQGQGQGQGQESAPAMPDIHGGGGAWLIWRPALEVFIQPLERGEHAFLHGFGTGEPLEVAASRALEADPACDLAATLTRHCAAGTFASIRIAPAQQE